MSRTYGEAGIDDLPLRDVLAAWDLEPVTSTSRATSGAMNETYLLTTARRRVVLRRHRRTQRSQVEFEHAVIAHAQQRGIPTPAPIRTPDGEYIVDHERTFYSLFTLARGDQVSAAQLTPSQAHSMGQALAHLHLALADFPVSPIRPPVEQHTNAASIATIEDLLRQIGHRRSSDERDRWAEQHLRSKARWLAANPDPEWHPEPDDARQLVHGDYQHTNLFFADDEVVDVIDWDKAEARWPVTEIVRTLELSLRLRPELCTAMIDGYRTTRDLSLDDLDRSAANHAYGLVHSQWLFEEIYLSGNDRLRTYLEPGPFVPFAHQWAALRPYLS